MQLRVEHTIDLPADRFFDDIYFNEDFNSRLFAELNFKERSVLEQVDRGESILRRVRQVPLRDLPEPFKAALGGASLGYEEQTLFHKASQRADIVVIPTIKPDKLKITGTFWVEPDGPDRCSRLFDVTVKLSIFGVGPIVEKLILADIAKSHDVSAEFTNRYIREHL